MSKSAGRKLAIVFVKKCFVIDCVLGQYFVQMESFFSGVRNSLSGRETVIKQSLISALSENAREIQFEYAENNCGKYCR